LDSVSAPVPTFCRAPRAETGAVTDKMLARDGQCVIDPGGCTHDRSDHRFIDGYQAATMAGFRKYIR
jgi:hypothetical protein